MAQVLAIEAKYRALCGRLDEATVRIWAATEARSLGLGGVTLVAKATGLSPTTILAVFSELNAPTTTAAERGIQSRARALVGGRKKLIDKDVSLLSDVDALVEPTTHRDPMSPLRWTCKSTYRPAEELRRQGHAVSQRSLCDLLRLAGCRLQAAGCSLPSGRSEGPLSLWPKACSRPIALIHGRLQLGNSVLALNGIQMGDRTFAGSAR